MRLVGDKVTWEGQVVSQGMVIVRFRARIPSNAPPQTLLTEATLVDGANLKQRFGATLYVGKYLLFMPIPSPLERAESLTIRAQGKYSTPSLETWQKW